MFTIKKSQSMNKFFLIFATGILLLSGCTEKIDVNLNDQGFERLVVEGWVTNQQMAHTVQLSLTTDYFQPGETPAATGATVTISDGTNTVQLSENSPGTYQTDPTYAGQIGKTYTLNIEYNGEEYSGSHYLDTVADIDSVYALPSVSQFSGEPNEGYYDLFLFTQELPGEGDHYMWRVYGNDTLQTDTLRNIQFVQDDLVDGNYIFNWNFDWVKADSADVVKVEQYSISKEIFDGYFAILLETDFRGGIFDSPPSNVSTNMSNGALGFFVAAGVSEYEFVIDN